MADSDLPSPPGLEFAFEVRLKFERHDMIPDTPFGFARGAVIVVLAWLALDYMITEDERPGWIQEAKSRPLVERGADMLLTLVPEELLERGDQAAEDTRRRAEEVRRAEQAYQQLVSPLRKSDAEEEQPTYNEGMRDEIEKAIEGLMTDETAPGETTQ